MVLYICVNMRQEGLIPQFLIRYTHKNCWTQLANFLTRTGEKIMAPLVQIP